MTTVERLMTRDEIPVDVSWNSARFSRALSTKGAIRRAFVVIHTRPRGTHGRCGDNLFNRMLEGVIPLDEISLRGFHCDRRSIPRADRNPAHIWGVAFCDTPDEIFMSEEFRGSGGGFMADYYVNTTAQANGDHEVHVSTCRFFPATRKHLGDFASCGPAVTKAKETYSQVNGCRTCAYACHTQ